MANMASTSSSSLTSGSGPGPGARVLLNNLILDKIVKCLSPRDLLHLRLTTTTWNRAFVPRLRKTHYPKSLDNDRPVDVYGIFTSYYPHLMEEYTEIMRTSDAVPFGCYKFCDLTADVHRLAFEDFFSVCGQTISTIKLYCSGETFLASNMEKIRSMIFELTPNLEHLHLAMSLSQFGPPSPPLWKDTKRDPICAGHLPNLKSLRLECHVVGIVQFNKLLEDLFRAATGLKEIFLSMRSTAIDFDNLPALITLGSYAVQLNKLKSLKIESAKWNELQLLSELAQRQENRLLLHQFALSIDYDENNFFFETIDVALNLFLVTQASTLRRLSIQMTRRNHDDATRIRVHLPRMPGLRALKLRGEGSFDMQFEGGTLADAFANLQHLEFEWNLMEGELRGDVIRVNQLTHNSVAELILAGIGEMYTWGPESDGRLEELAHHLPEITRLEAFIPSDHIPRCIWTAWPTLTVLHLEYTDHSKDPFTDSPVSLELDEWLSGIPSSRHTALEVEQSYQKIKTRKATIATDCDNLETLAQVRTLHTKYKSLAGLSDLHCLRSFTLIVVPLNSRWTCSLTDIGGYFGLSMANPGLERLIIRHNNQEFLAMECKSLIRFVLGPYAVIEPGGEWPCWAREGDGTGTLLSNYSSGLN